MKSANYHGALPLLESRVWGGVHRMAWLGDEEPSTRGAFDVFAPQVADTVCECAETANVGDIAFTMSQMYNNIKHAVI